MILLPMIGQVEAEGKTVPDFQAELSDLYSRYIREPNIAVSVAKYNSQKVYVLGRARLPGRPRAEHPPQRAFR